MRTLSRLAVPIAVAQAGSQMMSLVDTAVVGRLGAVPLAAIGLGNSLFFAVSIIGMGIVMGVDPLASQAVGAGDERRARMMMWQGVWLSALVTLALSVATGLIPLGIRAMHLDPEVTRQATIYLWIRLLSLFPMLAFIVVRAYLQALHITRPMVVAMIAGNVFNFVFDLLLVFGGAALPRWVGPLRHLPEMGISGAAISTLAGSILQLWIVARAVKRIPMPEGVDSIHRFDQPSVRKAVTVGMPVGLQMGAEYGIFALVGVLAGRFGPLQLAAHQVALTLISFTFTISVGIGSAGSVLVGRAVGARDRAGARSAGLAAFCTGILVMSISACAFLLYPRFFAAVITNQSDVVIAAIPLLGVAAFFQLSDGTQGVGAGVLRGAGDTHYPFFANVLGHWGVGFPIALWFGFHLHQGIVGLWWGLSAGLTAVAFLLLARFLKLSSREIRPLHEPAGV